MNHRHISPAMAAFILSLAAGHATLPAFAGGPGSDSQDRQAGAPRSHDYRSCHSMNDRKVMNPAGDEIATVSDLILDRGSGRVVYAILKTGSTFGMGGRMVAVPYNTLRSEGSGDDRGDRRERFVLDTTPESLKQSPEYTSEGWTSMRDATNASLKEDNGSLRQRLTTDAAVNGDPYRGTLNGAAASRIEGTVTKVERDRSGTYGEQTILTVQAADGTSRRVAMGPSWYVNGSPTSPMRGDTVVIDAVTPSRGGDGLLAATNLRTGGRDMRLRGTDGNPTWGSTGIESGGHMYSSASSRYMRLSDLRGMRVDCRGEECGKVHDVILDSSAGEITFLSVDPNQNFLGIGDTKRLIPWTIATVMLDGGVRVDATKEMLLSSGKTPSDLSTLNTGDHSRNAYSAFGVEQPRMDSNRSDSVSRADNDNAWSHRGSIVNGIESGSARSLKGEVVELTHVTFDNRMPAARALKMRLDSDSGTEEIVLLGPATYMDSQKPVCKSGDSITVDARRTMIDGRLYWIAKSVECKDNRVVLLDGDNNAPAWGDR